SSVLATSPDAARQTTINRQFRAHMRYDNWLKRRQAAVRYSRWQLSGQYAILPSAGAIGFGQAAIVSMSTSLEMPIAAIAVDLPAHDEVAAETIQEPPQHWPKSWPLKLWYGLCYILEWLFGLFSLLACLAVLAAIPVVNFLSLGYL